MSNQNARGNGGSEEGARGERLSHLRRFSLRAAVSVLFYEPQMEKHTTQNLQLDRLDTLLRKPVVSIQLVCSDFVSKRPETVVDCKPTRSSESIKLRSLVPVCYGLKHVPDSLLNMSGFRGRKKQHLIDIWMCGPCCQII